jgi:hypothetical protein
MALSTPHRVFVVAVLTVSSFGGSAALAEPLVWDNFDEYDADSSIIGQGDWEGWDEGFADAIVYEEDSFSEPNSLRLLPASDVVQVLSEVTEGRWVARAMVLVPADMVGNAYFLLLNTYAHNGPKNWSTQVTLNAASVTSAGGSGLTRPATSRLPTILDMWVEVRVEFDLDAGTQEIYYGGELLDPSHPWSSNGVNEIQCVDLYSDTSDGCLMDDVALHEACDIQANINPPRGNAPLEVSFDATESTCPNVDIEEFHWDFGDGTDSNNPTISHTYTEPGVYHVLLTMTDEDDLTHAFASIVGVGCLAGDLGPWLNGEVGEPSVPGCASFADGSVSLTVGGIGLGRTQDNLSFVHQSITGDFSMTARVSDVEWPIDGRVGLLMRETLEPTSRMAFAHARNQTGGLRARLERRRAVDGNATGTQSTPDPEWLVPNLWLRLDRVGDEIAAFESNDGVTWEPTRDTSITDLAPTLLVGLSASAGSASGSVSVTFQDINISDGGKPEVVFRRGDADASGGIELTDAIAVLSFLFLGGSASGCSESADADDNGSLELTDGVFILIYLFSGGAPPPDPGPVDCGPDGEDSPDIGCEAYEAC